MFKPVVFQMDPGVKSYRYFTITDNDNSNVGQVLVPKTTGSIGGVTYEAGTEYWFDVITSLSSRTSLRFSWQDYEWTDKPPSIGTLSFRMPENVTWDRIGTDPATSSTNFADTTLNVVIGWLLTYSGGTWGGTLTWYNTDGQNNVFGGSAPGSATLTSNTPVRGGLEWYTVAVSPL